MILPTEPPTLHVDRFSLWLGAVTDNAAYESDRAFHTTFPAPPFAQTEPLEAAILTRGLNYDQRGFGYLHARFDLAPTEEFAIIVAVGHLHGLGLEAFFAQPVLNALAHPIDSTEWGFTRLALYLATFFDPHLDKSSVEAVRERWEAVTAAWHGRGDREGGWLGGDSTVYWVHETVVGALKGRLMTPKLPHPIPYQGSKRHLAPAILTFFPSDIQTLHEPFAGSAAVAIAAAHHRLAQNFVLNDRNSALMALWQMILHEPERMAHQYATLWQAQLGKERTYYDWVRGQFNVTGRPDYFLYLLARCVKAAVRYNAKGEFNQSPDNRRKGARPETMRKAMSGAAHLLVGKTQCLSHDYRAALLLATPRDLVYLDPPYQGVGGKRDQRYYGAVPFDEFVASLEQLNARAISYIVSYDGRTGSKLFGQPLPDHLKLHCLELQAGTSSQATLLGRKAQTYESLYLSPMLCQRLPLLSVAPQPGSQLHQTEMAL